MPDPANLEVLLRLLIYGLAARTAYKLRVPSANGNENITILWIGAVAAGLSYLFSLSPWHTSNDFALYFWNTATSFVIGYLVGVLAAAVYDVRLHGRRFLQAVRSNVYGAVPRRSVAEEYLRNLVKEWVVVEMQDGQYILGGLKFFDVDDERQDSYHVVLTYPSYLDKVTWVPQEHFAEQVLICSDDFKSIRASVAPS